MKQLFAVLILAFAACVATAQPKTEYDKFDDVTTVGSDQMIVVREDHITIGIGIAYRHKGATPVMPEGIGLGVTAITQRITFNDCAVLDLIIDGVRSRIPMTHTHNDAGGKWWAESMGAPFRVSSMKTLANAQRIEGRLCHKEFTLTHADLAPLRALLATIPGIDAVEPTRVGSVE